MQTHHRVEAAVNDMEPKRSFPSPILIAIVLCLVAVTVGFYFYDKSQTSAPQDYSESVPTELVSAKLNNKIEDAAREYEAIMQDPTKSSEDKAFATINFAGVRFHINGDIQYQLQDIAALKSVVKDMTVSAPRRASAISLLSMMYNNSGRNPAVFEEVYKDSPFNVYFVKDDPDESALKLAQWSYAVRPSAVSAVYVAQLYANILSRNFGDNEVVPVAYADSSAEYLQKAMQAAEREAAVVPNYTSSDRYLTYLTWKAITEGWLAYQKGEPYKSTFKNSYDEAFQYFKSRDYFLASDQLFFTQFQYVRTLLRSQEDQEEAKATLDALAKELNELADPDTKTFVWFLRNEYKYRSDAAYWMTVQVMGNLSPDFKAAVDKVVESDPYPAN